MSSPSKARMSRAISFVCFGPFQSSRARTADQGTNTRIAKPQIIGAKGLQPGSECGPQAICFSFLAPPALAFQCDARERAVRRL